MNYDEAFEAEVSLEEVIEELKRHSVTAVDYDRNAAGRIELFDCRDGDVIAVANSEDMFKGSEILGWLGY